MKHTFSSRRARYGRLTVLLTVTAIAAVLICNILFTALAGRFGWLSYMGYATNFRLNDESRELIGNTIDSANKNRAEEGRDPIRYTILFCKSPEELEADDLLCSIYRIAREIEVAFPDSVRVSWTDIWRNPTSVDKYRGEGETKKSINDTSVIVDAGDRWSVLSYVAFYELSKEDYSAKGFNGNGRFVRVLTYLSLPTIKYACLTTSHGETFPDREITYFLEDAGYVVGTVDPAKQDIPEECSLLITYNPRSDLLATDAVSSVSETDRIERFLSRGNTYLVFLDSTTPTLPNLEGYLREWGVVPDTHTVTDLSGKSDIYRYMIQNTGASLTSDGYTLVGKGVSSAAWDDVFSLRRGNALKTDMIFADATSLSLSDDWTGAENRLRISAAKGSRTVSVLFETERGADAYAAGRRMQGSGHSDSFPLMTVTQDSATGGSVYVTASTAMLNSEYLQSVVYGNRRVMSELLYHVDSNIVLGAEYSTLASSRIESITTAQMYRITAILVLLPAIGVTVTALVVLTARRQERGTASKSKRNRKSTSGGNP